MRQFRADTGATSYFNYDKLYESSAKAHLIEVGGVKFWIPRAWIKKFNRKNKRIDIKSYWAGEIKLKLKGIVK